MKKELNLNMILQACANDKSIMLLDKVIILLKQSAIDINNNNMIMAKQKRKLAENYYDVLIDVLNDLSIAESELMYWDF